MEIDKIREIAIGLLHSGEIKSDKDFDFIVQHPFTNSKYVSIRNKNGEPLDLDISDSKCRELWYSYMEEQIEKMSFSHINIMINKPFRLYFIKSCQCAMTKEEFAEAFSQAWVDSENPNGDPNVSLREIAKLFEYCPATSLMNEKELEVYNSMPDTFTVYRGVSKGRVREGFSWTRDYDKASWFASRFGYGFVLKAEVKKEQVYAYFSRRGEDEYVINSYKIKSEIASGLVVSA